MLRLDAPAKINWTLDVLFRRDDGYHQLDTLMQTVSLCDRVLLEPLPTPVFSLCSDDPLLPADAEQNNALRAAKRYFEAAGLPGGVRLGLERRIPSEAGLGASSTDAAAVLRGLDGLYGTLSEQALARVALSIGADVPFGLTGGLCRCGGVGEALTPLLPGGTFHLILARGEQGVSTGELFRSLDLSALPHPDTDAAQAALLSGDAKALAPHVENALTAAAEALCPEISQTLSLLRESGALCASMSGSGSACFGLYESEDAARRALPALQERLPFAALCHTT